MPQNTRSRTCWFNKFFECLYLYIALAITFHMVYTSFVPYRDNLDEKSYIKIFFYTAGFITLTALVYASYWHRSEKKDDVNSGIKHAWLQGIMRYFLAFEISVYGFAKILQTQFATIYSRLDIPVGTLSGFELTWNYFGHSYTFAVILGCIQIAGGILLLFRRTTLAGVFTLLPVMVNIVFINIFYSIDAGAFINSLIITAGLTYLLMLRWADLKILFFQKAGSLPIVKLTLLKPLLKVTCIGLAFFCIFNISSKFPSSGFEGKWKVTAITHNGKHYEPNEWLNNPRAWSNIYIEQFGSMEFSSNPYIFEEERAWRSAYQYNAFKKTFNIEFYNAPRTDTIKAKIRDYDGRTMHWDMMYYSDTMRMELIRMGK